MTDQKQPGDGEDGAGAGEAGERGAEDRTRRAAFEDRLKEGLGALGAMKESLEETIREARERGDLSPEGARQAMREALARAQEKAGEARDAFDFVKQRDFDGLKTAVDDLKVRMGIVEQEVGVKRDEPASEGEESDPTA